MPTRYETVLAALEAGVVVHAADTQIIEANERARKLLGITDLEGRLATDPDWIFLEADHTPMSLERFPVMQVIRSGEAMHGLTMLVQRPDGSVTCFEANAAPIHDADGRLEQVVVTFIDVTDRRLAEDLLAAAEEELRLSFDSSSVPTCLVTNEGWIFRVNAAMCEFVDRDEDRLLTMNVIELNHPDDGAIGQVRMAEAMTEGKRSVRFTKRYVTGSGRVVWGDVTMSAVMNADGTVRHRIAQILDVTREYTLRTNLEEAERLAHMGAWHFDVVTGAVSWSPELYALFGLDPAAPTPDYTDQERLFTAASWERLDRAVTQARESGTPYSLELEIIRADGSRGWMEARCEIVRDTNGTVVELHGISLDITQRKNDRDQLQALATHDPLTGLANRAALLDELARAVTASRRSGRPTAILMMDLDRFKTVNDTLGHAAGDELLVAAAGRLEEVVRGGDLVARLGGDEFVVVMRDVPDTTEVVGAAQRLLSAFRRPFVLGSHEVFATASVGIALSQEGADAGDLLREADTAMYTAKEAGRDGLSVFNEDQRTAVTTRMMVETDLRHALEREELAVWYQPEIDLSTGRTVALEGLLRWHHRDGTVWAADRFIDVAEATGLILDIGDWVLRQACIAGAGWAHDHADRPPAVRVNASALQFAETGLLEAIDDALAASGLPPSLLCIELTETTLLRRSTTMAANLAGIRERGIRLAIDDFGTGYASLTYLNEFPVDVIKIDRSFIADGTDDHRLVAGIIALARTLGVVVTAEGVEELDQATRLHRMGCPTAQGWFFSAAVPAAQVPVLLERTFVTR